MTRKKSSSCDPPHLHDAVERYMKAMFSDVSRLRKQKVIGRGSVGFVSAKTEEIIVEIGQRLKGPTAFRDLNDLAQFLSDSLLLALLGATEPEKLDVSNLAVQIMRRLASPLQIFSFHAPLNLAGDLSFNFEIGGEHELKIAYGDAEGSMVLSGQVEAATEPSAIMSIEDLVAALLGICQALDLCIVTAPLPGSRHNVSVVITPHDVEVPSELSADVSAGIGGTVFRLPAKLTDLEHRHIKDGQVEKGLERHIRQLSRVLVSNDDHAIKLRHAAALLLKASVTRDIELALTYAFMCLEGLLLEATATDNVLSRLVEAVTYRIGTSPKHRAEVRRELKELYNLRSRYVHTGRAGISALTNVRRHSVTIADCVLAQEIQDFRP
jgi:hypothetical protein